MYGSDGPVDDSGGPGGGSGGPGRFKTLISYQAFSYQGDGGVLVLQKIIENNGTLIFLPPKR